MTQSMMRPSFWVQKGETPVVLVMLLLPELLTVRPTTSPSASMDSKRGTFWQVLVMPGCDCWFMVRKWPTKLRIPAIQLLLVSTMSERMSLM